MVRLINLIAVKISLPQVRPLKKQRDKPHSKKGYDQGVPYK